MITVGACVLALTLAQAEPVAQSDGWDAYVDQIVREEALERGVPGVALAVVKDSKILVLRGYGSADVETGRPVTAATPFNIASLSKPFTAAVVLRLARDGRIDLDAEVRHYLDWLPERFGVLTIRQLLTHTSGIVRDVRQGNLDDPDEMDYRERIRAADASAEPGARWEYTNTGFTVLGWAAERAGGAPLAQLLRRELFDPAGMLQAEYRVPLDSNRERARPYEIVEGESRPATYVSGGFGSGGISMSAADLAMFAVALQSGGVLSAAERELAWTGALLADGSRATAGVYSSADGYGCGWFVADVSGHKLVAHGGGINGYSASLEHYPDDALTIAVIANVKERDDGSAPVASIASRLAKYFLEPGRCQSIRAAPEFQASEQLRSATELFAAACVAGEAAAIARSYAAGAIALRPEGSVRVGPPEIAALFAHSGPRPSPMRLRFYSERVRLVGDLAVDQGTCYSDNGIGTPGESGRYLVSWTRAEGPWRMLADSWTEPPVEPAPAGGR